MPDPASHWEAVFAENEDDDVSWTQREPRMSLELLARAGIPSTARVIDVGCGAAGLAVELVRRGWSDVTGLDIAPSAIRRAKEKVGAEAARATWLVGDVRELRTQRPFDVWHDRAVLHFLVDPEERAGYVASLRRNTRPGGHAIVATFAPEGPDKCSGLPVQRYEAEGIARELGLALLYGARETHVTPWGAQQAFSWALMQA